MQVAWRDLIRESKGPIVEGPQGPSEMGWGAGWDGMGAGLGLGWGLGGKSPPSRGLKGTPKLSAGARKRVVIGTPKFLC